MVQILDSNRQPTPIIDPKLHLEYDPYLDNSLMNEIMQIQSKGNNDLLTQLNTGDMNLSIETNSKNDVTEPSKIVSSPTQENTE